VYIKCKKQLYENFVACDVTQLSLRQAIVYINCGVFIPVYFGTKKL